MRSQLISAFLPLLLASCAQPLVEARISREDVREICGAIRTRSDRRVIRIESDISSHYAAGSIPHDFLAVTSRGSTPIKRYIRNDLVLVTLAARGSSSEVYAVQKIRGSWQVSGTGALIHSPEDLTTASSQPSSADAPEGSSR
jgi:hypothetical protein